MNVCLGAYTLRYLRGGAYMWMFLHWALGLRDAGCSVTWLDSVLETTPAEQVRDDVARLERLLEPHRLAAIAVVDRSGKRPPGLADSVAGLDGAADADLFVNLGYDLVPEVVARFRRSAFVDIDPGLTQTWMSLGQLTVAPHDVHFTLGENVARPASPIPDCGLEWQYTPPPVHLPSWPVVAADPNAPYTTVSSWWGEEDWIEIDGEQIDNSKRAAFLPYLDLPTRVQAPLELAVPVEEGDAHGEWEQLVANGWRVSHAVDVSSSPDAFRAYVQGSRGEFSCLKRGYAALQTGWTGERVLAYLASGKPAILEHTGPSSLPEDEGLLRFHTPEEAVRRVAEAESEYDRHCLAARALVEDRFDAAKVIPAMLERAVL